MPWVLKLPSRSDTHHFSQAKGVICLYLIKGLRKCNPIIYEGGERKIRVGSTNDSSMKQTIVISESGYITIGQGLPAIRASISGADISELEFFSQTTGAFLLPSSAPLF